MLYIRGQTGLEAKEAVPLWTSQSGPHTYKLNTWNNVYNTSGWGLPLEHAFFTPIYYKRPRYGFYRERVLFNDPKKRLDFPMAIDTNLSVTGSFNKTFPVDPPDISVLERLPTPDDAQAALAEAGVNNVQVRSLSYILMPFCALKFNDDVFMAFANGGLGMSISVDYNSVFHSYVDLIVEASSITVEASASTSAPSMPRLPTFGSWSSGNPQVTLRDVSLSIPEEWGGQKIALDFGISPVWTNAAS